MKSSRRKVFQVVAALGTLSGLGGAAARADLLFYDPFDYTPGENLGGTDPDGAGPTAGTPIGQTNTYTGGGTWYARGTVSNYQSPNDTVISSGSLSYPGLVASIGNSVSYGSATPSNALYANAIDIPGEDITSGSLYASFIVRIKSNVASAGSTVRHSPLSFVTDTVSAGNAGAALASGSGTATPTPGSFWVRRDPIDATLQTTNFSPGKSSSDGIGPAAAGPSAGWQHSDTAGFTESNQFGAVGGQGVADINTPASWQTYFVVLKYEFDAGTTTTQNDTVSLWMNPGTGTLGSPTGEADASQNPTGNLGSYYAAIDAFGTATVDVSAIRSFALIGHRQITDNTIAIDVDELRIGTTWADVTPAAAATATYYWDVDGATPGAGGTAPSGNWDGLAQNFNTDSTGGAAGILAADSTAADTVVFAAGAGATGAYTVNVSGTRSAAQINVEEGDVTLTGGTLAVGAFDVSSGATGTVTSTIAAPASALTKSGAGTLQLNKLPQAHAVNITGGTVRIQESDPDYASGHPAGDAALVSQVTSLTLDPSAVLDITNNDVIVDYDGASPAGDLEALVRSAYNVVGTWDGPGITSSIAAIDGSYVVAIADNSALAAPFGSAAGGPLFNGIDVDLDAVLIKFTHRVDINLDGQITPDDAAIFGTNYDESITSGHTWAAGDMDFDGACTPTDAAIFGTFYDESLASLPEPAGVGAVLILLSACGRRRFRCS